MNIKYECHSTVNSTLYVHMIHVMFTRIESFWFQFTDCIESKKQVIRGNMLLFLLIDKYESTLVEIFPAQFCCN